jgi:hypothetical protein
MRAADARAVVDQLRRKGSRVIRDILDDDFAL